MIDWDQRMRERAAVRKFRETVIVQDQFDRSERCALARRTRERRAYDMQYRQDRKNFGKREV